MQQTVSFPDYTSVPVSVYKGDKEISIFSLNDTINIDLSVVESFGDEWKKFHEFSEHDLNRMAAEYFEIIPEQLYSSATRVLDVGCGSGRWSKILSRQTGLVDAVDPSDAIYAADRLLKKESNIRLTKASSEALPFADNTYDLVVSIGVLHHIPDTRKAMQDCVSKVKPGGYFYTYLYYNLDNRGPLFRSVFFLSNLLRKLVCRFPKKLKKITCDILAIFLYMPFVFMSRLTYRMGMKRLSDKIPLSIYRNKSFFIIRNDALDRFGTKLEQRFTRVQVCQMMAGCGLTDIVISDKAPYWHAIGQKH